MNIRLQLKKLLERRQYSSDAKKYSLLLKQQGIKNTVQLGEEQWYSKWAVLGIKPTKECYRLFSRYIGNDDKIVPEYICHHVIEQCLNPVGMVGYYTDKNMYNRLFPKEYLPATIFRYQMGGGIMLIISMLATLLIR